MTKMTTYDALIVGGGHNGLVTAAYLAKAGKRVLVLEASDQLGGMAKSHKIKGDYTVSLASILNQFDPQIEKDLGLTFDCISQPVSTTVLQKDREPLVFGDDDEVTGLSNPDDAAAYSKFRRMVQDYAASLRPLLSAPPIDVFNPDRSDKMTALKLGWKIRFGLGKDGMRELLRVAGMNIYDWLDEIFDDAALKGAIGFDACLGHKSGPRTIGSVFTYLYRDAAGAKVRIPKGGMGSVTEALAKAAQKFGAEVRTQAKVAEITVDGTVSVSGVVLENGERLSAPIVIANTDPKTTVFDLVGPRHFEADFVKSIDNLRSQGSTAKLHLLLDGLPSFSALGTDEIKLLSGRLVIAGTARQVERCFDPMKYGEVAAKPMMEITLPTVSDDSLAPTGHHILSATIPFVPHDLKGGWSEEAKLTFRKACIDHIADYAPDLHSKIIDSHLLTPPDIAADYGVTGGHWHHGEMALDQLFMLRPAPMSARHSLPLDGLYLCGAGTHPGGGVMGVAGMLAAKAALKGMKS